MNYGIFIAMNDLISELKSKLTPLFSQESKIISAYVFGYLSTPGVEISLNPEYILNQLLLLLNITHLHPWSGNIGVWVAIS